MKNKFKRLLSCLSAIAVTASALPIFEPLSTVIAADQLLNGDVNKDGIIDENDTTALSQAINKKNTAKLVNADLNGDGKITNADTFILNQYVTGEIKYFPVGDVYEAGITYITRADWIHNLVTVFDMSVENADSIENFFTDISDSPYASDIELAANFGVFDVTSDSFDPDAMVTREFAAHTANFCIGYLNDYVWNFSDIDDIIYEDDATVSVQKGWFETVDTDFRPSMYMRSSESEMIIKDIQNALKANIINPNATETLNYTDAVIRIDGTAVLAGNTVTIKDENVSLIKGNVFTVNINGTECLYKAGKVTIGSKGELIVEVEDAELEEAVKNVDVQGYGEIDYDNITYYGEGTSSYTRTTDGTLYMSSPQILAKAASNSNAITLNRTITLGTAKVNITGSISNIKPEYKLQYDGKTVESFYLNVNADANLTASCTDSFTDTKSKEVKIAAIPVFCGGVLNAEIGVYATISLSGEISVSYSYDIMGGVSYTKNGGWRTTKSFKKKAFTLDANSSESLAIKAAITAKFGPTKIAEAYVMAGEKGRIEAKKREDGTECCTLDAYLFAEFGANADVFGLVNFSKSVKFIDSTNSPIKVKKHWENDVLVDKCKYEDISSGTTSTKIKRKVYSEYSQYGTEFENVISISNSAESKSDGSITKWEGNIKLSKDTVIYGDLLLTSWTTTKSDGSKESHRFSSLDLDGKQLTVYGDIIQTQGEVTVNNGRLNIEGSYIMQNTTVNNIGETVYNSCSASLIMENEYDKVTISGNLTTHNLGGHVQNVRLDNGVLTVGGNIWSDGGINVYKNGNKLVLNGSGNQSVYTIESYVEFNEVEVTNPSKRLIIWGGKAYFNKLVSDINIKSDNLNLYSFNLNQHNMTIAGDTYLTDTSQLDLNGGILTIKGNVLHKTGRITVNNGTLNITGNYTMENTTTNNVGEIVYNSCSAYLNMTNEYDKVNISGNLTTHNLNDSYSVQLNNGVLTVGGNIWSDRGIGVYSNKGNKLVLNGSGNQSVYTVGSYGGFNEVEVTNPDKRLIIWGGKAYFNKLVSDINIKSDNLNLYSFNLNQHNMTIAGDTYLTDTSQLDLNGGILTIKGNVLHKTGRITVNNGTLNITGNYTMENTTTNNVGEIVYNSCSAYLNMTNEYDKVNISGNLTTHNLNDSYSVQLNNGVLTVGGNIWSDRGIGVYSNKGNKLVLNGSGNQSVYTVGSYGGFNEVEVTNPDKRLIIWGGKAYFNKLVSDINIKSDNLNLYSFNLNQHNMTIAGDTYLTDTSQLDLNGGILTIKGNVLHKTGRITVNNGTLNITGNYTMENTTTNNVGEIVYNSCSAYLNMTNEYDKVNIFGNLTTHNLNGSYNVRLDNGVLTVGGNIWSDKGVGVYSNNGNKTILSGTGKQTVTLNKSNKFNTLVLTKPMANYTFNPDECWNSLMMIEYGSGDCNLDGQVTIADAVMLQKWLLCAGPLDCWQAVDLCKDNRIDVFDLVLLKRMILAQTK